MHSQLHLASGAWELEVQPGRGGAVTALRHAARSLLVSPDAATPDAMGAASFALLPYANRIARGTFAYLGRQWVLPGNFGAHPHPLHGIGWQRSWSVLAQQADAIELGLQHAGDAAWPWPFSARQLIVLQPERVRFDLAVTNHAALIAPMGLGFHPAFAAHATTMLHVQLESVWQIDADSLPVSLRPAGEVLPELPAAVPVRRNTLIDHCFPGWPGRLRIEHAGFAGNIPVVEMTAAPQLSFLQLYMPPGRDYFCAEPMSQMPDAINHPLAGHHGGLRFLQPGETLQVWMEIAAR